jgi:orotate phosphoribosyltransferase
MSKEIAQSLNDAGVMKFGLFTLASNRTSPVYIDIRILPSTPKAFDAIVDALVEKVKALKVDVVAGCETAGIPIAAAIAIKAGMPMIYVRKRAKGYGTNSMIEGVLKKGQKVVLIDDMITNGKSKIGFVEGVRKEGAVVSDCLVILDREQGGSDTLAEVDLKLHSLITLNEFLEFMKESGGVDEDNYNITKKYLSNPEQWSN